VPDSGDREPAVAKGSESMTSDLRANSLTGTTYLTEEDYRSSATVRDLKQLDALLEVIRRREGAGQLGRIVDIGCGFGALTIHISRQLDIAEMAGVDRDPHRLAVANGRGIATHALDLNSDPLPYPDGTFDVASSFGVLEHLVFYDNVLEEAFRVLRPGGWLLLAIPNLGSYLNRAALLVGRQPRNVEVSRKYAVGILPGYSRGESRGEPLGHIRSATLHATTELLRNVGFEVVSVRGASPNFGSRAVRVADVLFGRIPALSRRFIVLARRPL
jgi:SAM-dependent methyltransferase